MTSWTVDIATGVAERLAADQVCEWDPEGLYHGDSIGCFVGLMPDQPDDAIAVTVLPMAPGSAIAQVVIQVRVRTNNPDPRDTHALAQDVIDCLDDLRHVTIGEHRLPHVWLQSMGDLGPDPAGRPEVALNFYSWARFGSGRSGD
ncbi:hypothetical protein IEE94_11195 [Yimella sp. cx-573]|nr:hypothetical protein [Yimella sp. cx-573]